MKTMYLAILVAILAACGPAAGPISAPTPQDNTVVEPIQIDQVDIRIMESFPVQVSVHVTGVIGDGCAKLHSVEQTRTGNAITITINRQRPIEAVCTQIAQLYDETIALQGDFHSGDYTLKVNDVERTFHID